MLTLSTTPDSRLRLHLAILLSSLVLRLCFLFSLFVLMLFCIVLLLGLFGRKMVFGWSGFECDIDFLCLVL